MLGEGLLLLIGFAVQFAAHLEAKLQQEKLKKINRVFITLWHDTWRSASVHLC